MNSQEVTSTTYLEAGNEHVQNGHYIAKLDDYNWGYKTS